ncbi:MAG: hypothetical protein AAGC81_01055 [Pseudomonadota bacterium]
MSPKKENPGGQAGALDASNWKDCRTENTSRPGKRQGTSVIVGTGEDAREVLLSGRVLWAIQELLRAGPKGITSIDYPGIRLAHFIFMLRKQGFAIVTEREAHGGQFPASHPRYRLHTQARIGGA